MHALQRPSLEHRIAAELPDVRLPAGLLQRLSEALTTEAVQLVAGDLRPLGFGAYQGALCLVTPTRVLLATATGASGQEGAFGLEQWDREVGVLPRFLPLRPREPEPDAG